MKQHKDLVKLEHDPEMQSRTHTFFFLFWPGQKTAEWWLRVERPLF